jgi:hypothetical protein
MNAQFNSVHPGFPTPQRREMTSRRVAGRTLAEPPFCMPAGRPGAGLQDIQIRLICGAKANRGYGRLCSCS